MSEVVVLQVLEEHGISPAGALIRDDTADERYFVFVNVGRSSENRQVPSNRRLHEAREHLAQQGVRVEFLLKDTLADDIEAGLRATILHAFINQVRNVFLSVSEGRAHIWIEPKTIPDDDAMPRMRERALHFLADFGLTIGSIRSTVNENLPSKLALLGVLRLHAPVTLLELRGQLEAVTFVVPSAEWLNRRLDALRREGAVVRTEAGLYALSLRCLTTLGTKKNAASPDVTRLLAMARLDA